VTLLPCEHAQLTRAHRYVGPEATANLALGHRAGIGADQEIEQLGGVGAEANLLATPEKLAPVRVEDELTEPQPHAGYPRNLELPNG
jgi:hypothetical protein